MKLLIGEDSLVINVILNINLFRKITFNYFIFCILVKKRKAKLHLAIVLYLVRVLKHRLFLRKAE